MRRVVVVGGKLLDVEVPLLDHRVVRELPALRVELEFQSIAVEFRHVLQLPQAPEEEGGRDVLVINPEVEGIFVQGVEDRFLREAVDEVLADVAGGAV